MITNYIYQEVPVQNLMVDHDYQRKLSLGKVKIIAKNYDPRSIGVLIIHERENGDMVILDGQHRWEGAKVKGEKTVPCFVYKGLSKEEEAKIFIDYNTARATPKALDVFKAKIEARNPDALKIKEIVERNGHRINFNNSGDANYGISAVYSLVKAFNYGGEKALDDVFKIINKAWLGESDALHGMIIYGVYCFIRAYQNESTFSQKRMVKKLSGMPVVVLIRKARGYSKLLDGSLSTNVARAILEVYNQNLGNTRLPDKFSNVRD